LENDVSLPTAQQRTLDRIADGLRRSEPKLAAMYGIFARLCSSEALPRPEQLIEDPRWRRWPGPLLARLGRARLLIASQVAIGLVLVALLAGLTWHGPVGCGSAPHSAMAQARLWCPAQGLTGGLLGK
jgi:hypothetical protein